MADVASLIVRITTQSDKAAKDIDATAAATDKWRKRTGVAAAALAAGSAAVIAFGAAAVKSASRTEQSMGGIEAVFGKNADTVKKWAAGAATSVGLAKSEYAEFAAVIGSQLKGMGLPLDQVTGKTSDLIKMGADLAATYGGTTGEAVAALSSALKGETDPIERYGVSLKAADVAAQKAADGTDKLTGKAAKQATAMATLSLITQSTADAHGQFAKQSGSAAEQAQIAGAQFENMKSSLGTVLLPVVAMAAGLLGSLARVIGQHPRLAQIAGAAILALSAAVIALVVAVKVYQAALIAVQVVQKATWLSALGPIGLVIAAVLLVVGVIVLLWKRSATFRAIVLAAWAAIRAAAVAVGNAVRATWNAVFAALSAYVRAYLAVFRVAFNAVAAAARAVAAAVRGAWAGVTAVVGTVAGKIKSALVGAFDAVKRAAAGIGSALSAPFNTVKGAIDSVIGAVQSLIGWLGRIKVPSIHLPKIPGVGRAAPASVPAGAVDMGARVAAPIVAPRASGGGSVTINITGAIDPESTARQIRRILAGSDIRHSVSRGMRTA